MEPSQQWNRAAIRGEQVASGAPAVSTTGGAYHRPPAGISPTANCTSTTPTTQEARGSSSGVVPDDPLQAMDFDEMLMWFESDPSLSGPGSLPSPMNSVASGGFSFSGLQNLPGPQTGPTAGTSGRAGSFRPSSSALGDPMKMESGFAAGYATPPSVGLTGGTMNFAGAVNTNPYHHPTGDPSAASAWQQAQNFNVAPPQGMGFVQLQAMQMKQPLQLQPQLQLQPTTGAMPRADNHGAGGLGHWNTYQGDNSFMKGSPVTTGNSAMPQVPAVGAQSKPVDSMAPFTAALEAQGGPALPGLSQMPVDNSSVPLEQLETNLAKEMNGTGRKQDVPLDAMQEFSLEKLHPYPGPSFLYSQMLKSKAQRTGPQQKGRTSAKDKMNDLERQVAELQQQKQQLTEQNSNLECRIGIVDRMVQLRRESHAEATADACRIDEQLEAAQKMMGNMSLGQGGGMLPMNRRISHILEPDYVDETFLLMSSEWKVIMKSITSALLAVDGSPPGTDLMSIPAAADLQAAVANMHSWFMQQQTRGGINLLQEFMLWLYNQECVENGKDVVDEEFHKKYKRMYHQLGLTLQQKERIKLASDVYDKRTADQSASRDTYHQALLERSTTEQPRISCVEAYRDLLESEEAVQGLRAFDTTMRENRLMFSIILFRKVLTLVQQARLNVTSFPLIPCVKTLAQITSSDLAAVTGVKTTKIDDSLVNQMTKPDVELKAYTPSPSPSASRQSSGQMGQC